MVCFHCPTPIPTPIPIPDSYEIGFNNTVQNFFHFTYTDSYLWFLDTYCTQFDTNISTDKVVL